MNKFPHVAPSEWHWDYSQFILFLAATHRISSAVCIASEEFHFFFNRISQLIFIVYLSTVFFCAFVALSNHYIIIMIIFCSMGRKRMFRCLLFDNVTQCIGLSLSLYRRSHTGVIANAGNVRENNKPRGQTGFINIDDCAYCTNTSNFFFILSFTSFIYHEYILSFKDFRNRNNASAELKLPVYLTVNNNFLLFRSLSQQSF